MVSSSMVFDEDFEDFKADILSLYKRVFLRPKTRSFSNLLQEFYDKLEKLLVWTSSF